MEWSADVGKLIVLVEGVVDLSCNFILLVGPVVEFPCNFMVLVEGVVEQAPKLFRS